METTDRELLRQFNDLIARVGALERAIAEDLGERWSETRIADWEARMIASSDRTTPRSDIGAAHFDDAVGRLAARLMAVSRHRPRPG